MTIATSFKPSKIALFVSAFSATAFANTETVNNDSISEEVALDTIIVTGVPFSQQVGTQKITAEQIKKQPAKDGNITELLRNNPNVRFSNDADSSVGAGEIAPNEVSINGEKFYNNNYTIDGLNNNDNFNPETNNEVKNGTDPSGYSPTDLPSGGAQSMWIDTHLIKNVEVFDSNISAKYGRFTGGVINAELVDPDLEKASGKVFYRTTRDSWAEFHLENEDTYNKAEKLGNQPKFTKQQYGISVSQPLSDKSSLLFSYNRSESKIPYHHDYLEQWDTQRRINETYLLKGIYLPENGDLWRATVMYSPHRSEYFKKDIKNGGFTNTGGGVSANLQWEKNLDWTKIKTTLAYKKTGNEVEHNGEHFYNYLYTGSNTNTQGFCSNTTCKSAQSGGYGTFSTEKSSYTLKQDWSLTEFEKFALTHKVIFGWEVEFANAKYKRNADSYHYIYTNDVLTSHILYPARNVKADDNIYAAYLEDSMQWKRLNVNVGVRFDRSEFLGNNNFAPRFSASYDIFGNGSTQLFGGLNRYYSGSVLTYKLKNLIGERTVYNYKTNKETYNSSTNYDVSGLDTPYSDERVLGISQKLWGVNTTLKWVHRNSKDQFTRTYASIDVDGVKTYYMTNGGRSKNDSVTLNIKPEKSYEFGFAHLDWDFGAQISKTESNYTTYSSADMGNNYSKVIVDGKLKELEEAPITDYNIPWSTFANINLHFPKIRLDWTNRLSYNAGYRGYTTSSVTCPGGHEACGDFEGTAKEYKSFHQGSHFLLDWRFVYKQPTFANQYLELSLDVNNVLNRKVIATSSSSSTTYKMGRNFWLGASYNW